MTWHAIRTLPGAQMPQREYQVEPTEAALNGKPRGKGYRIVPSLNPKMSAVERSLWDAGYRFYMPSEYKVIRNRSKTNTYTIRRFAMLQGYVFVTGVEDWLTLRGLPGVDGVVAIDGAPLPIHIADIMKLRAVEAASEAKADREVERMNAAAKASVVKAADKALKHAKRHFNPGQRVKVIWGPAVGHEAIVEGWDAQQIKARLDAAETVLLPYEHVKLVA